MAKSGERATRGGGRVVLDDELRLLDVARADAGLAYANCTAGLTRVQGC
jgi:hypothetical protein